MTLLEQILQLQTLLASLQAMLVQQSNSYIPVTTTSAPRPKFTMPQFPSPLFPSNIAFREIPSQRKSPIPQT